MAGAEISERDLYDYTNGRFLNDEKSQLSKRRVEFNLSNLCNEAVSVANGSPVRKIEKMEGGFSKALVITTENGKEVVAKLPCPNAGRAMYSTASEAAVLQYVSTRTQVPVPKLLAWNADATNPVGAEYIIMEKAPGVQLFTVWDDLSATDRIKLIKSLTQLEHQLAAIQFPAYGNLYFRQSIPEPSKRVLLDSFLDPTAQFCVGPSCDPAWTNGTTAADIDSTLDMGPLNNNLASDLQGNAKDHIVLCDMALKLLPNLAGLSSLQQSARPTIWHTDLHMGNIFVSEQDHSQIVSVIDWQHISISPLFLQARWPVLLSPPDDYALGPRHPELSSDFENFDPHDKEVALFQKERADASKAYEIATYLNNRDTYVALWKTDQPAREFFKRIGDTWDDGMVPLQMCLLKICENWGLLGFSDPCPLDLSIRDVETFNQRSKKYKQWYGIQEFAKKYLDTDDDGWIAPQMDFDEKRLQNKALLDLLIERAQSEEEARETRRMWPFPT
ncbi:MAG: hypothetical protein Q9199_004081 [Rusavskia elegans]